MGCGRSTPVIDINTKRISFSEKELEIRNIKNERLVLPEINQQKVYTFECEFCKKITSCRFPILVEDRVLDCCEECENTFGSMILS